MTARKKKKRIKAGTTAEAKDVKRKLFVQALIANGENRTAAAIEAGYSPKTAAQAGARLYREVKTQELLEEARKIVQTKFGLTAENVARQLAAIVNFDPRMMFDKNQKMLAIDQWPDTVAFAVGGLEVTRKDGEVAETITKHKIWDKNAGIGHAIKVLGLSRERQPLDPLPDAPAGEISMLDAARRMAFVLRAGAEAMQKQPTPKAKKKQPA